MICVGFCIIHQKWWYKKAHSGTLLTVMGSSLQIPQANDMTTIWEDLSKANGFRFSTCFILICDTFI